MGVESSVCGALTLQGTKSQDILASATLHFDHSFSLLWPFHTEGGFFAQLIRTSIYFCERLFLLWLLGQVSPIFAFYICIALYVKMPLVFQTL